MDLGPSGDDAFEDILEVGERLDGMEFRGVDQAGCDRPLPGTAIRRDVMMPGVWDARSRFPTHSIRFRAEARWSSPIRSMMAVAI